MIETAGLGLIFGQLIGGNFPEVFEERHAVEFALFEPDELIFADSKFSDFFLFLVETLNNFLVRLFEHVDDFVIDFVLEIDDFGLGRRVKVVRQDVSLRLFAHSLDLVLFQFLYLMPQLFCFILLLSSQPFVFVPNQLQLKGSLAIKLFQSGIVLLELFPFLLFAFKCCFHLLVLLHQTVQLLAYELNLRHYLLVVLALPGQQRTVLLRFEGRKSSIY